MTTYHRPALTAFLAAVLAFSVLGLRPDHFNRSDFKNDMRELWGEHVTWTRLYLVSAMADMPDKHEVAQRLLKNQDDIGDAFEPFFGERAGTELATLLKEHITIATEVVEAARRGSMRTGAFWKDTLGGVTPRVHDTTGLYAPARPKDTTGRYDPSRPSESSGRSTRLGAIPPRDSLGRATVRLSDTTEGVTMRWRENADRIADFLSRTNSAQWPAQEMRTMMRDHLELLTEQVKARARQDWTADVAAYDRSFMQIMHMADMLSEGIVKRFPDRFESMSELKK